MYTWYGHTLHIIYSFILYLILYIIHLSLACKSYWPHHVILLTLYISCKKSHWTYIFRYAYACVVFIQTNIYVMIYCRMNILKTDLLSHAYILCIIVYVHIPDCMYMLLLYKHLYVCIYKLFSSSTYGRNM